MIVVFFGGAGEDIERGLREKRTFLGDSEAPSSEKHWTGLFSEIM